MVARNERLPEGELPLRLQGRSVKVRGDTFLAIRDLSLRHNERQAGYIARVFRLLLAIESRIEADPLAYLEKKFSDSA